MALVRNEDVSRRELRFILRRVSNAFVNTSVKPLNVRTRLFCRLCRAVHKLKLMQDFKSVHKFSRMVGMTALHYAVLQGDADIVNELLRCGADPRIKNALNRTPIEYSGVFREIQGALKRVASHLHQLHKILKEKKIASTKNTNGNSYSLRMKASLTRRLSTANACRFPMWLISLKYMHRFYGSRNRISDTVDAHQDLKVKGNMLRWRDLP
jgi:hypothetical protein